MRCIQSRLKAFAMTSVSTQPSSSITHLNAFDPQALVLALQEGVLEHVQLERGRFGGQIAHTISSQCRTDWGHYNLALLAQGDLSPEWLSVGIFLHGNGRWRVQSKELSNGDLVVYSQGSELCITLPPKAAWVSVQVPRHRLEALGFHLPAGLTTLHLPGRLSPESTQTLAQLATVLGPQRLAEPLRPQCEQAHEQLLGVVWAELMARWHLPSAGATALHQTRQRLVQAVHQWCSAQDDAPLRLDAICQDLDVPIWQLERAFLHTYGMAPHRLITLHRLAKARRDLLTHAGSVTEVALAHGFWHLGRFSLLYKDYFGENPSATARLATEWTPPHP